jgi:hypothetical protein
MPFMTFDEIKQHYGGVEKARVALGLKSRQTLYNWKEQGVPDGEQCRIQILTDGVLKASEQAVLGAGNSERAAA